MNYRSRLKEVYDSLDENASVRRARAEKLGITTMQLIRLEDFATIHGRSWKSELRDQWMKAKAGPELQALRNSHGPSWLQKFKF